MVEIDGNAILVKPIKSYMDEELARLDKTIMIRLRRAGIITKNYILDNEVSEAPKTILQDGYQIKIELVLPGTHHRNTTKVAIRNSKAHFLSVLAGTAEDFLLQLWDRLLPQAEITINLLQ